MAAKTVPVRIYYAIFGALIVLTLLTVGAAYVDLGAFNPVLAILIAVFKASLVILFFMHVKYESRLTLVFALSGFVWLAIMIGLSFTDYGSRSWTPEASDVAPRYFEK